VLGAEPSSTPPVILNSPGQVLFDPDGTRLVVFVKGGVDFLPPLGFDPVEPAIHVFQLDSDGLPAAESKTTFADRAPFSGVFDREGRLFVAWVFSSRVNVTPPGIPVGGVSSYEIVDDPEMPLVPLGEDPVEVAEFGTCWIATDGKRYAYASNTLSNTITGFRIGVGGHGRSSVRGGGKPAFVGVDGSLHELDTDDTGVGPLDVALSDGGHYVYVLNGNPGTSQQSVSMFKINRSDGSLESIGEIQDGLPEGSVSAEGMVGY
jgi:hypothetical protein